MTEAQLRRRNVDSRASRDVPSFSSNSEENTLIENASEMNWWHRDRSSVLLLFLLYVLQGVPLGLARSIPMLLAVSI